MAAAPAIDYSRLKVLCILEGPGTAVLTFILKRGTNAPNPPISLEQYLSALPPTSTANYCRLSNKDKRKAFTDTERKQINAYLSWDRFDVTLLYKAIRFACEDVAQLNDTGLWRDMNNLEGLLTKIKDERNTFVHERPQLTQNEFEVKVRKLKDLFMKVLEAAQTKYSVSYLEISDEKRSVEKSVKDILKCFTIDEFLRLDSIKMLEVFKNMIMNRLNSMYENAQVFDPLYFLSGSPQTLVHVQKIFSTLFVKEKQENIEISYLEIVGFTQSLGQPTQPPQATQPTQPPQLPHPTQPPQVTQSTQPSQPTQSAHPQLLLINGVAGSGKTTLLTFILSEWLKEECDRRLKHMDRYDIVLHISCREANSSSLQEFLEQVLPEAVAFRPNTMTVLKKCKVLFLIDGLDEWNSSSRRLAKDILQQGKEVPAFTIICTSRQEAIVDFVMAAPKEYGKGEVMMEGISPDERTEFVLKYYECLCGTGSSNPARVRQVMESIGWRDHFALPLNLLFLATLLHYDPDSVRENTNQTTLYIAMHEWCVEKLQYRLAEHPQSMDIDRVSRKESISVVFNVISEVALAMLLQDRLNLSAADMHQLTKCCKAVSVPSGEVLGAFFSLQQSVVRLVVQHTYYAPHKGLLEFYSANKIVKQLAEGSSVRSIRQLLQDTSQKQIELYNLRNLLLHVAGLLCQPHETLPPGPIQEVVDLLKESGMEDCNDWLSLLEDTEVNNAALERVAEHIRNNSLPDDIVKITDSTITSAAALLPLIPRKDVRIEVKRKEADFNKLTKATAGHTCTRLYLWQHYKQPNLPSASDSVLHALPRSDLMYFMGHLNTDGIMLLQESRHLENLYLAVSSDRDAPGILSTLDAASLSPFFLYVNVPVKTVNPDVITKRLPDTHRLGGVLLVLSGVNEIMLEKTCRIAAALMPRRGYLAITFPDTCMKAAEWKRLLKFLADARVRVGVGVWGVMVPDTITMTDQEEHELNNLARAWNLGVFRRVNEYSLWRWPPWL